MVTVKKINYHVCTVSVNGRSPSKKLHCSDKLYSIVAEITEALRAAHKDALALGLLNQLDPSLAAEAIALTAPAPRAFERAVNNVGYFTGGRGYLALKPNPALAVPIAGGISAANY